MPEAAAHTDTAPPPTPTAIATRAAIADTAERLFRTLGYQKTTVADIARELRMSPANVYRFFPSKAAITEEIAERLLRQFMAAVWTLARGPEPAPDRIRALFRLLHDQTMAMFFHERRMHDMVRVAMDEHWEAIKRHISGIDGAFAHIVRDGQRDGVFGTIDAEQAGRLIHCTCALFSHPTLVQQCQDTEDLPALADGMAEFCLRALRPG